MANNKQKELNRIIDNCISCCIINDEDNQFGSEKIWGYINAKL